MTLACMGGVTLGKSLPFSEPWGAYVWNTKQVEQSQGKFGKTHDGVCVCSSYVGMHTLLLNKSIRSFRHLLSRICGH